VRERVGRDAVWPPTTTGRWARRLLSGVAIALVAVMAGCTSAVQPPAGGSPAPSARPGTGYLSAVGGKLVDALGRQTRLTGVAWFGFETSTCAPHGLSQRNWRDMLHQMRMAGFNVLRLPFSNQLLDDPRCAPQGIDYRKNPDLQGLKGLALLDQIIQGAGREGLDVILDRHAPVAGSRGDLWYTDQVPESRWISDWTMLARHYRHDPAVVGADLANEPHGVATWGDGNISTDWRLAAERAGNAILAANPDWLILVQGIQLYQGDQYWWGGNLEGAGRYPVRLSHPDKLVYAPHDYGPGISAQEWFNSPAYPRNLPQVWERHWAYLTGQGATVLMGEFGGSSVGQDPEGRWQRALVSYLDDQGMGYLYWAWNADSTDTSGMLQRDWKTINQSEASLLGISPPSPSGAPG
jgi:endoglucanase